MIRIQESTVMMSTAPLKESSFRWYWRYDYPLYTHPEGKGVGTPFYHICHSGLNGAVRAYAVQSDENDLIATNLVNELNSLERKNYSHTETRALIVGAWPNTVYEEDATRPPECVEWDNHITNLIRKLR